MSLQFDGASGARSACSTSAPSSRRNTCRSTIDTTSIRPSGNQPRPLGWFGTLAIVSDSPCSSTATTRWPCMSEKNNRPSCQRGPSGNASPSSKTSVECTIGTVLAWSFGWTDVVEAQLVRLGQARHEEDRGDEARDPAQRDRTADAAERIREVAGEQESSSGSDNGHNEEQRVRRAAQFGGEQLGVERAEG